MLALVIITLVLIWSSLLVGRAALVRARLDEARAGSPAIGLALLIVASNAVIALGGDGFAAALVDGALVLVSAAYLGLAHRDGPVSRPGAIWPSLVVLCSTAVAAIPFLCNRGIGTLGVSRLDDLAIHEYWAWSLQHHQTYAGLIGAYPIGAHSLVAALATATSSDVSVAFSALILATPALSGLTVYGLLSQLRRPLRLIVSVLVGLTYLSASFIAEGAFKEPIIALFLLGLAGLLRESRRVGSALGIGILVGASLLVEGSTGAIWPGLACAVFVLLNARDLRWTRRPYDAARALLLRGSVAVAIALVAVAPELGSLLAFAPNRSGSNVATHVSVAEAFGVWGNTDFRMSHTTILDRAALTWLGVLVLVVGCYWFAVRRQDRSLVAIALGALAAYGLICLSTGNPYLQVKSLMVASVPIGAVILGMLFELPFLDGRHSALARLPLLVGLGVAALYSWSTLESLRAAPVGSGEHDAELASIRTQLHGQPTLFLVMDDFGSWKLRGVNVTTSTMYGVVPRIPITPTPYASVPDLTPTDGFARFSGPQLDRFRYAVTTNAAYNVSPPPNWSLVGTTRHYALWQRHGTTPARLPLPREVVRTGRATCSGRAFPTGARTELRPASVVGPGASWTLVDLQPLPTAPTFTDVRTGQSVRQALSLPAGTWEIDLQYQTSTPLTVEVDGRRWSLPANLDVFGPYWKVGTLRVGGSGEARRTVIAIVSERRPFPAIQRDGAIGAVVAVRTSAPGGLVPTSRACGKPIEWIIGSTGSGSRMVRTKAQPMERKP